MKRRSVFVRIRCLVTEGEINYIGRELAQIRDLVAHYQEMDPQAAGRPRDAISRSLQESPAKK
jgi:hypothetical protein